MSEEFEMWAESEIVRTGGSFTGWNERVRQILKSDTPRSKKIESIKKEYGTGGRSISRAEKRGFMNYSPKCLIIELGDILKTYSWSSILDIYERKFLMSLFQKVEDKSGRANDKVVNTDTGEIVEALYESYSCPDDYIEAEVIPIEPMTAKEEERLEILESMLESKSGYVVEEKFDGVRGTLHFYKRRVNDYRVEGFARLFSRRISKKTNWYNEKSDSLPHLRDLDIPELAGTVIDGELFIPDRPFAEVSGTLNCLWKESIFRQIELGLIVFHAFDIIYYKGVYIAKMPLWKRKHYLDKVVKAIRSPYVKMVQYSDTNLSILVNRKTSPVLLNSLQNSRDEFKFTYPELFKAIGVHALTSLQQGEEVSLSKRAYYEYLVANGKEGIIIKDINGKYYHKRGREYTKLKKFKMWDCIIIGFSEPTKEYNGKAPSTWQYYEDDKPVSKFYSMNWVGNIRFGVTIPESLVDQYVDVLKRTVEFIDGEYVLEVGECSGFDEEMRAFFTKEKNQLVGEVVEIKAQEIIDSKIGTLRHPRYNRLRPDKGAYQCTFDNHIERGSV